LHLIEKLHALVVVALRHVVNFAQELEGLDHGDVPPKLRALAEDDADGLHVLAALLPGHETIGTDFTAGGHENAGEHFDGGGFAGAVGADVADHFAGLDVEGDAVHGVHRLVIAFYQIADRAPHAFTALERAEMLGEIAYEN